MGVPMSAHVPASKQICYYFKIHMQSYANVCKYKVRRICRYPEVRTLGPRGRKNVLIGCVQNKFSLEIPIVLMPSPFHDSSFSQHL